MSKTVRLGLGRVRITLYVGKKEHKAYASKAMRLGFQTGDPSKESFLGETCGTVMWLRKADEGVLLHEVVHAVQNALAYLGVCRGRETDTEVLAYSIEQVYMSFISARKRVKKGSK